MSWASQQTVDAHFPDTVIVHTPETDPKALHNMTDKELGQAFNNAADRAQDFGALNKEIGARAQDAYSNGGMSEVKTLQKNINAGVPRDDRAVVLTESNDGKNIEVHDSERTTTPGKDHGIYDNEKKGWMKDISSASETDVQKPAHEGEPKPDLNAGFAPKGDIGLPKWTPGMYGEQDGSGDPKPIADEKEKPSWVQNLKTGDHLDHFNNGDEVYITKEGTQFKLNKENGVSVFDAEGHKIKPNMTLNGGSAAFYDSQHIQVRNPYAMEGSGGNFADPASGSVQDNGQSLAFKNGHFTLDNQN